MVEAANPFQTVPHFQIICIHSVLAPSNTLDRHMIAPLHCNTYAVGDVFLENWSSTEPKWHCGVMVEASHPCRLYPTYP